MATRVAQIAVVLVAFGGVFVALFLASVPPRPLFIGLSIAAAILCLIIAIRPITSEGWHSFWDALANLLRWW